jgi:V/A-type H+-transporting ATPase subunit I
MPWRDTLTPVRMERIALVAPTEALRDALARVAVAGSVELDTIPADAAEQGPFGAALRRRATAGTTPPAPALSSGSPQLEDWTAAGRYDLIAGEAQLEERARGAVVRGEVAALAGWAPAGAIAGLNAELSQAGGAAVPIPRPRGVDVPTLLPGRPVRRALAPLVETYGTVPYADLDPTVLAAASYVLMFGMMFGDAGHGLLLLAAGALLWWGRPARLARFRRAWPFVVGAGACSVLFGLLYGEFFGPTGVVPVLWIEPLQEPIRLLLAAVGAGALLLAGAYTLGIINRWREGGWPTALLSPSGIAGAALFGGGGLAAAGILLHQSVLVLGGSALALAGLVLAFIGFQAEAGSGGSAVVQSVVELFDLVIRLGSNVASFARLAAFGLTHAALGLLVWTATSELWQRGGSLAVAAVVTFVLGNAVAFALEALIAAVQALRLEYYELFSRLFRGQGRPFQPWQLSTDRKEAFPCSPG